MGASTREQLEKLAKSTIHLCCNLLLTIVPAKRSFLHMSTWTMGVSSTCSTKLALWYKILELRFLLQKQFSSSNRLPQDPVKSSFCEADENVRVAYSDLITSSKETLDSILELQEDITNQVAAYMRDPSRMIKQMRLRKSTVSVFESVAMEDLETLYAEANAYALASHIFWALWALIQIQLLNINLHHVMMIVNEIMTLNVEFE
ncbi:hypothetical protein S83_059926 [Arachis hypogaea]